MVETLESIKMRMSYLTGWRLEVKITSKLHYAASRVEMMDAVFHLLEASRDAPVASFDWQHSKYRYVSFILKLTSIELGECISRHIKIDQSSYCSIPFITFAIPMHGVIGNCSVVDPRGNSWVIIQHGPW